MKTWLLCICFLASLSRAGAHDIYTGVRGNNGQLCCGGNDCVTTYREHGGDFEFLTRERHWIAIPIERITFLPIPGDQPSDDDTHKAHLCYAAVTGSEGASANVFSGPGQSIYLYCAFIPPQSW